MENIIRKLPVPLTDEGKIALGAQLASKETDLSLTLADAKAKAADARKVVKEQKKRIGELVDAIHTGHELREVECVRKVNADGKTEIIRLDTNEVVEVEDDEDDEDEHDEGKKRQPKLPFKKAPPLSFWARDVDGELHKISAEQRDVIAQQLQIGKPPIDVKIGDRVVKIEALQGNLACDVCGLADGNHRADAHKASDAAKDADVRIAAIGTDGYVLSITRKQRDAFLAGERVVVSSGKSGSGHEVRALRYVEPGNVTVLDVHGAPHRVSELDSEDLACGFSLHAETEGGEIVEIPASYDGDDYSKAAEVAAEQLANGRRPEAGTPELPKGGRRGRKGKAQVTA